MTFALLAILSALLAIGTSGVPVLGGGTVPSAHAADRLEAGCEPPTEVEREICYRAAAARSRGEVERAFERNLRTATALDREWNAFAQAHRIRGSSLAGQLKASQAAWLSYSQSQCSFEGGTSRGGSGTDILEAACHYRLNSHRLSELQEDRKLLNRGRH
ncbi:MAG TPA: lysozyme inhibitor LprI family protein [Allosphingosinicella sp.]|jgi:uncharacterized protein YecT (DUF1311 family)